MNVIKEIRSLNAIELSRSTSTNASWHADYASSSYIYIGGLPFDLTEGDVLAIFEQYGKSVDLHLVRDQVTGSSKGFGFMAYEDQRSTILAVDNLSGIKVLGRTIRVDHCKDYRPPKGPAKERERRNELDPCGKGGRSSEPSRNRDRPRHGSRATSRERSYSRHESHRHTYLEHYRSRSRSRSPLHARRH